MNLSIVLLLLAIGVQQAWQLDSVVFTNSEIAAKSIDSFDLQSALKAASVARPLVLMLVDDFCLADFSAGAHVYTQTDDAALLGQRTDLANTVASSMGYTSAWLSATGLPKQGDKTTKEFADGQGIADADVIIIRAKSLAELDANVKEMLGQMEGRTYTAVITDPLAVSTSNVPKTRSKRQADAQDEDNCVDGLYYYIKETGVPLVYVDTIQLIYYSGNPDDGTLYIALNASKDAKVCFRNDSVDTTSTTSLKYTFTWNNLEATQGVLDGPATVQLTFRAWGSTRPNDRYWELYSGSLDAIYKGSDTGPNVNISGAFQQVYRMSMNSVTSFQWACVQTNVLRVQQGKEDKYSGVRFYSFNGQPFYTQNGNWSVNIDDCIPLFSEGSWMGIVVGFILLSALLFVLIMLSNLSVNDRFDDPKGKPLQINVKGE